MRKIRLYIEETYNELVHKVTWPKWTELQGSAIVVMIASFVIAFIIAIMDTTFENIMNLVYSLL